MNRRIYDAYGKDSLERFVRFLPPNLGNEEKVQIVVYWDGANWPQPEKPFYQVEVRNLEQVRGFTGFQTYAEKVQHEQGVNQRRNAFLWNARRFACKGFAWGDYLPDEDVIWLDADVKIFDHVPVEFLRGFFQTNNVAVQYLGRSDSYTETGFLAFNHAAPYSYWLRRAILSFYRDRGIFDLKHWTDCHVFDACLAMMQKLDHHAYVNNLTPDGKGFDHVFNQSVLGRYMDHCKGPRKKLGYSPENYKSADERDYGERGRAMSAAPG